MKTRLFTTLLLLTLFAFETKAQCEGGRYRDKIYSTVNVISDISYGQNQTYADESQALLLDVYQATGDLNTLRPLVIMAHGGYFVGGNKADESVAPICTELAKMGYVTSSISYRLGIPLVFPLDAPFMEAIMRAVQDMRAAVRFFRKSVAENGNPYGINPDEIYIGGVSAGGFIALHLAYLDEDELPANINLDNPGLEGGLEGQSGSAGYSSAVNGIISVAGAIGDSAWIEPGDLPAFLSHGSADAVVPFGSDMLTLFSAFDVAEVDGSSSIHEKLNQYEIENCFEIYWGQDHVPQQNIEQYFDTTISIVSNFLSHFVCPATPLDCDYRELIASAEYLDAGIDVVLYPNPTTGMIYLSEKDARVLGMYSSMGKKVDLKSNGRIIDCSFLPSGVYFIEVEQQGNLSTKRLIVQ